MPTLIFVLVLTVFLAVCLWSYRVQTRRGRRPEDVPEPDTGGPSSCPRCACVIEQRGDWYVCVGCRNRDEIERYLVPEFPVKMPPPADLTEKKPCGWTGAASEYGKSWR